MTGKLIRLLFAGSCVWVGAGGAPAVSVSGAWARATAPGQTEAAVYLTLTTRSADSLVSMSSPQAAHAMLHLSSTAGGMASMTDMASLALPQDAPVRLQPRGAHVMLSGLAHGLTPGERVTLTLRFAHADPVVVQAPVLPIGSAGP